MSPNKFSQYKDLEASLGQGPAMMLIDALESIEERMATKADLERFATKADLERFATKADLERFATKADLERFATKADLERYATKADLERYATRDQLESLRDEMHKMEVRLNEKIAALRLQQFQLFGLIFLTLVFLNRDAITLLAQLLRLHV